VVQVDYTDVEIMKEKVNKEIENRKMQANEDEIFLKAYVVIEDFGEQAYFTRHGKKRKADGCTEFTLDGLHIHLSSYRLPRQSDWITIRNGEDQVFHGADGGFVDAYLPGDWQELLDEAYTEACTKRVEADCEAKLASLRERTAPFGLEHLLDE